METSLSFTPPASGGVSFYPARYHSTFPSVRAALASVGCTGAAADLYLANARLEGSDLVALPVGPKSGPGPGIGDALALIRRKPGGRAELLIGIPAEARDDEREALAVAADFAAAIPGRWCVCTWVRQARAVQ